MSMLPRSSIWLGDSITLHERMVDILHKMFCDCTEPMCEHRDLLMRKQHKQVLYVQPSAEVYRIGDIDDFLQRIAMVQENDLYCIIENADQMPAVCAHAFLKLLEEPPHYYYFLLHGSSIQFFLPTIISRAVVFDCGHKTYDQTYQQFVNEFAQLLMIERGERIKSIATFEQLLITYKPDVSSMKQILDLLIERMQFLGASPLVLNALFLLYDKIPMPGAREAFLRTIYLVV